MGWTTLSSSCLCATSDVDEQFVREPNAPVYTIKISIFRTQTFKRKNRETGSQGALEM